VVEGLVLDVLLVLVLLAYLTYGIRNGLSRSAFVIGGVVAGVVAAYVLAPLAGEAVPIPFLQLGTVVFVAVALVVAGHWIGSAVGRAVRSGVAATPLGGVDRLLGAIVTTVASALVASVLAFSVGQLGVPALSRAIAGSTVLRIIGTLTPDPVEAFLAQVRGTLVDGSLPVLEGVLGPDTAPDIPAIDTGDPELNAAAQSVVRITGNAYACGQSQSGTGFVVAPERVITNAHVLAGITEPVIEAPNGQALIGSVVYFDPVDDLAVVAVPGLVAAGLPLADTLPTGAQAAVQGYPYGGPFTSGGAEVLQVSTQQVSDISGSSRAPREIYTLAADVREGNSGGPLLTLDGAVAGVVFARSGDTANVGYAATMAELDPVAAQAGALSSAVSTGACIRG
jgi:S1-C subfamily serine protease